MERALELNDVGQLADLLAREPDAAFMPLEKHVWEPPICAAARLGCELQIFTVLLQNGATPDQEDARGRVVTDILMMRIKSLTRPFPSFDAGMAEMLAQTVEQEKQRLLGWLVMTWRP